MVEMKYATPYSKIKNKLPRAPIEYNHPKRSKEEDKRLKDKIGYVPWDPSYILKEHCSWYLSFGERQKGKTYQMLQYALGKYNKTGYNSCYVRRLDTEIDSANLDQLVEEFILNGEVPKWTEGRYSTIVRKGKKFYLASERPAEKEGEDPDLILDDTPFLFAQAINTWKKKKGGRSPLCYTVIFDEFITDDYYLTNEPKKFQNLISSLGMKEGMEIFLLGNTLNIDCPYFDAFGLWNIDQMTPGEIKVYSYGKDERLRCCVEYTDSTAAHGGKPGDYLFAFNDPDDDMVVSGCWDLGFYPGIPMKFEDKDIRFSFFIKYKQWLLQGDLVQCDRCLFIAMHKKTTEIKYPDRDLIYSDEFDPRPNYRRKITEPRTKLDNLIYSLIANDQIYYADNTVGNIFTNYLKFCN